MRYSLTKFAAAAWSLAPACPFSARRSDDVIDLMKAFSLSSAEGIGSLASAMVGGLSGMAVKCQVTSLAAAPRTVAAPASLMTKRRSPVPLALLLRRRKARRARRLVEVNSGRANDQRASLAAMDLFVVPTIGFDLLYVLVIVRLARRDLVWIDATPVCTEN
jgi:hypothetical protein